MEFRKDSIIEVFKTYNAILEGHFLLSSGLHSDKYIQCALVLQYPKLAEKIAMLLYEEIRNNSSFWQDINVIISPAIGGIVIGQEVARVVSTFSEKQVRAIFTERNDEGKMVLRRGFQLSQQDKCLVVEDVVTTGKSTKEVIEVVNSYNAEVLGVCSIFNRGMVDDNYFGIPYFYVAKLFINTYSKEECPLCKQNIPLVKPGSRKIM
jgi:orotate phosphoribosyltransferase